MFDMVTNEAQDLQVEVLDALVVGEQAFRWEVLTELARLDIAEMWKQDGATSMADWLVGRYPISVGTAREWITVAQALTEQPTSGRRTPTVDCRGISYERWSGSLPPMMRRCGPNRPPP